MFHRFAETRKAADWVKNIEGHLSLTAKLEDGRSILTAASPSAKL
jgi:hypothetical protein